MTREQFINNKVEHIINQYIVPTLNKRDTLSREAIAATSGMWIFLCSVGRMDTLRFLMKMSRILTDEEFEAIDTALAKEEK